MLDTSWTRTNFYLTVYQHEIGCARTCTWSSEFQRKLAAISRHYSVFGSHALTRKEALSWRKHANAVEHSRVLQLDIPSMIWTAWTNEQNERRNVQSRIREIVIFPGVTYGTPRPGNFTHWPPRLSYPNLSHVTSSACLSAFHAKTQLYWLNAFCKSLTILLALLLYGKVPTSWTMKLELVWQTWFYTIST